MVARASGDVARPQQRLAWLDEAAALLDKTGRGGSRLARDVENARRELGAPAAMRHPQSGSELVAAANDVIARATASLP